jgi:serine/threonine-protein kinase
VPIVQVPSVAGEQLASAIQQIQAAGLTYTVKYTTSDKTVGTVISQDPAGGSRVRANVPIALTVSGTQTSVSVPSVLGQSPTDAGAILTRAGLNIGSQTSACSSQFPTGLVSAQNPGGGANVPPNTAVNLVISNGSCISVPNVVGQTASSAISMITSAGLVANQTTDTTCANNAQPGIVDAQNPPAGTPVENGTTVTVAVCQPVTTTTTSSTTTSTTSAAGANAPGTRNGNGNGNGLGTAPPLPNP